MKNLIETNKKLYETWKAEEDCAHIHGWDFSHIAGRYEEEQDLDWDYDRIVRSYMTEDKRIMDFDTGGGEFLLSLNHPYDKTAATEGYPPNVDLCQRRLSPLGIDFRPCDDCKNIPFEDESFDLMINRHGDFHPEEIYRLLKTGGAFVTEQVGGANDRELVDFVLPNTPLPFPQLFLDIQVEEFKKAGFEIIEAREDYKPIRFYDVGAFVWFARIIEWEFPGFSVDSCFDKLLEMNEIIAKEGCFEGTIHRYLIVAKKK